MSTHATGGYETRTWDERTLDGEKWDWNAWGQNPTLVLTRASVTNTFQGGIEGEGTAEYLMTYRPDGACTYIGYERIDGRVDGRSGSFVIQHAGTFEGGRLTADWTVVPGSGTGDLSGMKGKGGFVWNGEHGVPTPYTLDYSFE